MISPKKGAEGGPLWSEVWVRKELWHSSNGRQNRRHVGANVLAVRTGILIGAGWDKMIVPAHPVVVFDELDSNVGNQHVLPRVSGSAKLRIVSIYGIADE